MESGILRAVEAQTKAQGLTKMRNHSCHYSSAGGAVQRAFKAQGLRRKSLLPLFRISVSAAPRATQPAVHLRTERARARAREREEEEEEEEEEVLTRNE